MKKFIVLVALVLLSSPAFAVITNSAHDFSTTGAFNAGGEICVACHTPHNSMTTVADAPLWNHLVTTQTFQMYTSTTLDGSIDSNVTSGRSRLCLSCHDGVTNLDAFGGSAGTAALGSVTFPATNGVIGTDLRNDHPIAIEFDFTADGGLNHESTLTNAVVYGTPPKVECSSCHEVHNESNITFLLRASNVGSAFCLECHNK